MEPNPFVKDVIAMRQSSFGKQFHAYSTFVQRFALMFAIVLLASTSSLGQSSSNQMTVTFPSATHRARGASAQALTARKQKVSYALGMSIWAQIGGNLTKPSVEVDPNLVYQGLKDAMSGGKTRMTQEQAQAVLQEAQIEVGKALRVVPAAGSAAIEKPPEKTTNLGDNFGRAALLALKGILSDASTPSFENGAVLVNRHTSELLQAADVEIVNKDEKDAYEYLHRFFIMHIGDNQTTDLMRIHYEIDMTRGVSRSLLQVRASEAVSNDPRFIEMNSRESACSLAIENRLRSRTWNNPSTNECDPSAKQYQDSVR